MVEILTLPEDDDIKSNFEPCGARCACVDRQTEQSHATNAALWSEYNRREAAQAHKGEAMTKLTKEFILAGVVLIAFLIGVSLGWWSLP